jgi:hypothetical protein
MSWDLCKRNKLPEQSQVLFTMFERLDIEPYKKSVLQERYLAVLQNFQLRADRLSILFYNSRIIVTVGSILIPAFLSIQGQGTEQQIQLYWTTWLLSLVVSICNGLLTLFKLDKKYFFINTTLELLHSEGWQYIGLSGRYAPKDAPVPPTHENQFLIFFHMAEKIKMRQVEEEYWKFTDTSGVGNATNQAHPLGYIQTPATQQGALALLPAKQKSIIEGWLSEMKMDSNKIGLLPRNVLNTETIIDGDKGSPQISRTPDSTALSM